MEPSGAEVQGQTESSNSQSQSQYNSAQPTVGGLSASQSQYRNRFFSTPQLNAGRGPRRGSLDNLLSSVSLSILEEISTNMKM